MGNEEQEVRKLLKELIPSCTQIKYKEYPNDKVVLRIMCSFINGEFELIRPEPIWIISEFKQVLSRIKLFGLPESIAERYALDYFFLRVID